MKGLMLSAYDAASHQHWRRKLVDGMPDIEWTELSLPARFFAWRSRGNSLSWAFDHRSQLTQSLDFLIATSMTDLCSLKGFVPELSQVPSILYFHENQFEYPENQSQHAMADIQLTSIYSALSADQLVFNSRHNLSSFLSGVRGFLKKMPDQVPKGLEELLEAKSTVVPVPLDINIQKTTPSDRPVQLLWNHRWEYDKGPDRLLMALKKIQSDFQIHIVGQQFRNRPTEFEEIRARFGAKIKSWGYAESEDYLNLLKTCDLVISTATHDFQGLSILEAAMSGCEPVVPNRLAYQEIFDECFRYESSLKNPELEASMLAEHLDARIRAINEGCSKQYQSGLEQFHWTNLRDVYESLLKGLGLN